MLHWKSLTILILIIILVGLTIPQTRSTTENNFQLMLMGQDTIIYTPLTININPSDDSHVLEDIPDGNYGNENYPNVAYKYGLYFNWTSKTWLKFDLSSVPLNSNISSVQFYIKTFTISTTPTIDIHFSSNDTWSESTITWNNQPIYETMILDSKLVNVAETWYSFSVTSKTINEYNGDKIISFVLNTTSSGAIANFYSSETSNKPYLKVNYVNPLVYTINEVDGSLGFQHDPEILFIQNTGALLNGTDTTLNFNLDGGSLTFLNDAETTVEIWAEQCPDGVDLSVSGASVFSIVEGEDWSWTATLPAATIIGISWSWRLESYIDKYTMFGIGMVGVGLIFFACIWAALGFKKWGFDIESISRFDIAMIVFLIGLGFIIVWLWR